MLIASTVIYTRYERRIANSFCLNRQNSCVTKTPLYRCFRDTDLSERRNSGCDSVMDVPTANGGFVANREKATSRQASFCWTSLSQVSTRSTASSNARCRTASANWSSFFCTLETRRTIGRSGSRAAPEPVVKGFHTVCKNYARRLKRRRRTRKIAPPQGFMVNALSSFRAVPKLPS
jgi:hypothetical protein